MLHKISLMLIFLASMDFAHAGMPHCIIYGTIYPLTHGPPFPRRHFQMLFLQWKCMNIDWILIEVSSWGPINNIPALVQMMAWHRPDDKPLSEPILVSLLTLYASLGLNELRCAQGLLVLFFFLFRKTLFHSIKIETNDAEVHQACCVLFYSGYEYLVDSCELCTRLCQGWFTGHDDVIKWNHFPRYWTFVRGIHRSPVNSPHKGQWRGASVFSLICAWIND